MPAAQDEGHQYRSSAAAQRFVPLGRDSAPAKPAERRELPPNTLPLPDERTMRLIFNNYWTCEAGAGWEQTNDDPRG